MSFFFNSLRYTKPLPSSFRPFLASWFIVASTSADTPGFLRLAFNTVNGWILQTFLTPLTTHIKATSSHYNVIAVINQ